jgi:diguanylate cyclase (GGDEF)-like protein
LELASRSGTSLCAVFIDIDHFKTINDTYGHTVGDKVLCKLTQLLSQYLRKTDLIYRYGGEEFVIILPETELSDACNIAEELREYIENHDFNVSTKVTVSLGVAERKTDEELQVWLNRADLSMYEAKKAGRNRVQVADVVSK